MRKVKASDVLQDLSIYPRCTVDDGHVATLALVLEAGGELPPIVICRKTRRVVDGFHRLNAHGQYHGWESEIAAVEKDYIDDREMWLDAIRYNAKHGLPLTASDRHHCELKSKLIGVDGEQLSLALGITSKQMATLVPAIQNIELAPANKPRPFNAKKKHTSFVEAAGEVAPGSIRCHGCGAKLLPDAECVSCDLSDAKKRKLRELDQQTYEQNVEIGTRHRDSDDEAMPDGWQERLAELRQIKVSGDELGFHVDWILNYLESREGDVGDATLRPLAERLAALFELSEAA